LVETLRSKQHETKGPVSRFSSLKSTRVWLEFLLPVVIGVSLWFLIDSHF